MLNYKTILKVLGQLLYIEVALFGLCLFISGFYKENDHIPLLISMLVTLAAGIGMNYAGRGSDNNLSIRDAFFVVTMAWIIFSFFGTQPFLYGGYISNFTDAFFEAMAGFTTTGASIIDNVEMLPRGILFWRSLMQWIGGLGIVFFTIAVLPSMSGGSVRVFAAEATGPIKTKLHPRISKSSQWIWIIYVLLTVCCGACYFLFGMGWFDALNYSMTTTATGGFATHNSSTEFFNSPLIEYTCTFFCFLSGVNFVLLYTSVSKLRPGRLFKSAEFKMYFYTVLVFTAFVMYELIKYRHYDIEHAFRSSIFTVVSFITTTGLFNDDAGQWPRVTWIVLTACMFLGACSGSTSGGFKSIRTIMMLKVIRNEFRQLIHPNAVLPLKVDNNNVPLQKRQSLMALLSVYLILFVIASFVLTVSGVDVVNSITIILSCLGNVGPTLGVEIGPTMSWADLSPFVKWVCSFYMLLGRLEIFTVLVIFTRSFWMVK